MNNLLEFVFCPQKELYETFTTPKNALQLDDKPSFVEEKSSVISSTSKFLPHLNQYKNNACHITDDEFLETSNESTNTSDSSIYVTFEDKNKLISTKTHEPLQTLSTQEDSDKIGPANNVYNVFRFYWPGIWTAVASQNIDQVNTSILIWGHAGLFCQKL